MLVSPIFPADFKSIEPSSRPSESKNPCLFPPVPFVDEEDFLNPVSRWWPPPLVSSPTVPCGGCNTIIERSRKSIAAGSFTDFFPFFIMMSSFPRDSICSVLWCLRICLVRLPEEWRSLFNISHFYPLLRLSQTDPHSCIDWTREGNNNSLRACFGHTKVPPGYAPFPTMITPMRHIYNVNNGL